MLGKLDCNSHIKVEYVENGGNWPEAIKLKDIYSKAKGMIISLGQGEDVLLCQVVVITDCAMHDHIFDEKWGQ